ncbi:MAG: hypothetical protein KBE65_16655 [Phycisphaerae bacterium]|nr:hypothetical protein [Phycisphaerae bacterium]
MPIDRNHESTGSGKRALTVAPFVIGAVALYNWAISPHVGYLHAMHRLEPVVDRMAEELNVVGETLEQKRSLLRSLRAELATVREGVHAREQAKAFVHDLQVLVGKAGCVTTAADFACDQSANGRDDPNIPVAVEVLHADFTIQGQYDSIVAFLQTVRERPQAVWIDSCQIELVDSGSDQLECRLGLTLYIAVQPGELHP